MEFISELLTVYLRLLCYIKDMAVVVFCDNSNTKE